MKPRYKMAAGMFLFVVLAGVISAAILIVQGSRAAMYAQIGMIPLLVIVGYLWVNRTVQASGTSRNEFERRKARQVGEQFSDAWQLAQQIEAAHPAVITDAEWDRLERHAEELNSEGISFDTSTGAFDVSRRNLGTLEDINRLETDVEELEGWILTQFTANVEERIRAINQSLSQLNTLVGGTTTVDPSSVSSTSTEDEPTDWKETGELLEACYQEATETIESACEELQAALQSTEKNAGSTVEHQLSDARQAANENEYERAVTAVLDARDTVQRDASENFQNQQETVHRLLQTASRKQFDQYLGPSYDEEIQQFRDQLDSFDDAIEIADLRSLRQQTRQTCIDIVEELETQLSDAMVQLDTGDVPEGWYDPPTAADHNYTRTLRNSSDLETFRDEFDRAVKELLRALNSIKPKASVIRGYDKIASEISDRLRETGSVTGDDIPVSEQEEQFLGLYYRKNMEAVEFDPEVPQLTAVDGGESYEVTVTASFPEGGAERQLTITLEGPTTRTEICNTPLVAERTFEDVPYGEYTVTVEAADESYATAEETLFIDEVAEIDLTVQEVTLREQLCEGIDVDPDKILENMSSRFETRFEEEGYLSTEMSFPVDEDSVPCLLAAWGERAGQNTTRHSGEVIVYDSETLRKEIENVVRYNLEAGESRTYEELRQNFLSAPIPNEVVEQLIEESSERDVLEIDDTRLKKVVAE